MSVLAVVIALAVPAVASATPPVVSAYYMYGTSNSAVAQNAYNDGCAFAHNNPGGYRVMMLDFGRPAAGAAAPARSTSATTTSVTRATLTALESASNGAYNCFNGNSSDTNSIGFGVSNYHMTQAGMSTTDSEYVGESQSARGNQLFSSESNNGRVNLDAVIGVDMEPAYDYRPISNNLVNGANQTGGVIDYDYGSADGCPSSGSEGSCSNGWGTFDVAWASFSGNALPLPEIYYTANAGQWTVIKNNWDSSGGGRGGYFFDGVTGETGAGLSPQSGCNTLAADDSGLVNSQPGIVCFGC